MLIPIGLCCGFRHITSNHFKPFVVYVNHYCDASFSHSATASISNATQRRRSVLKSGGGPNASGDLGM